MNELNHMNEENIIEKRGQTPLVKAIIMIASYFVIQFGLVFLVVLLDAMNVITATNELLIQTQVGSMVIILGIVIILYKDVIIKGLGSFLSKRHYMDVIQGLILIFVASAVAGYVVSLFETNVDVPENQEAINQLIENPSTLIVTAILVVFLAPIIEEIVFRYALKSIVFAFKQSFSKLALNVIFVILSGVIFGAMHDMASLYFFQYAALGVVLAFYLIKTDNILVPVLIHFVFNTAGLVAILLV